MQCSFCGFDFPSESDFCPFCGIWNIPTTEVNPIIPNPPELKWERVLIDEEVILLPPIPVEKWIQWGVPNQTIERIVHHRREVAFRRVYERRVKVPNFAYLMPQLPEVEEKAEVFAMAIDTDGSIDPKSPRYIRGRRYVNAVVEFTTATFDLTLKIANMLNTGIGIAKLGKEFHYRTRARRGRAVRACYLMQPHTIKFKQQVQEVLTLYRKRTLIPVP